jgi:3-hydroxyisobutyrate dehydrogenase-like beta-hydroxyacid dehydrogenase
MVQRLLLAAYDVHVFVHNNAERGRTLAEAGATIVRSVQDLARCGIVISALFDDRQFVEVFDNDDGLVSHIHDGSVIVTHTTGDPRVIQHLSRRLAQRGATIVDAPFSGTAEDVRAGRLIVLTSGDESSLDRVEPAIRSYAGRVTRCGALGRAMFVKLVNNALFAANAQLAMVALAAAAEAGIEAPLALTAIDGCSGSSVAWQTIARHGSTSAFTDAVTQYLRKDVAICAGVLANYASDGFQTLAARAAAGPLTLS